MKRSVRAWVVIDPKDGDVVDASSKRNGLAFWKGTITFPCTITYDDGKKPRRKAVKRSK